LHRDPDPLREHRDPHDDVADDDDSVVHHLAFIHRVEDVGDAECQHKHADHLHHGRDPVEPVVGVERRGEPREVDPRPAHREHDERERQNGRPDVALGDEVGGLAARLRERDDEGEVEEQLERGRSAVTLARVPPGHPAQPMLASGILRLVGGRGGHPTRLIRNPPTTRCTSGTPGR
jgi:hypothetical protein